MAGRSPTVAGADLDGIFRVSGSGRHDRDVVWRYLGGVPPDTVERFHDDSATVRQHEHTWQGKIMTYIEPISLSEAQHDLTVGTSVPPAPGRVRLLWNSVTGVVGAILGIAPHVLHHVGLLAGTAVLAGAGGTALFGVVGLIASVPMLLRLRRRFGTWRAPSIALGVFTVMFALSAFVIGPAIGGSGANNNSGTSTNAPSPAEEHASHHGG